MGRLALAALLTSLAACALEQPPGVVRVTYECNDARGFVARYERNDQVILELTDQERVLPRLTRRLYDDGTRQLRLNGRFATLIGTTQTYSNCIARDWQEQPPNAAPPTPPA